MNAEEYGQMKQSLIDIVPRNAVAINLPKKLILRTPNGSFVKFGHMKMDAELLKDMPQMTIDMLHNKLIIQWTDDIDAETYENVGMEILGKREWSKPRAEEALSWIAALFNIKKALGYD